MNSMKQVGLGMLIYVSDSNTLRHSSCREHTAVPQLQTGFTIGNDCATLNGIQIHVHEQPNFIGYRINGQHQCACLSVSKSIHRIWLIATL